MNTLNKVLKTAEHMALLGDEENAYIFYMKYFNLITIIQHFTAQKGELRKILGTNSDINKRFDVLGEIKESLKNRWE